MSFDNTMSALTSYYNKTTSGATYLVEALKAFGSRPLAISKCQFTFVLVVALLSLHLRTCLGCVRGGKARCVVAFVDGCSFWLCPS